MPPSRRRRSPFEITVDNDDSSLHATASLGSYEDLHPVSHNNFIDDPSDYARAMDTLTQNLPTVYEACAVEASALSQPREHIELGSDEDRALRSRWQLIRSVIETASRTTPDIFGALPEQIKNAVQLCDRLNQMRHIQDGSTYETPMGNTYPEQDAREYIDDFCSAVEGSLREQGFAVSLQRPERVQSINAVPNLLFETLDTIASQTKTTPDTLAVFDTTMQESVIPFTARFQPPQGS